MYLPTILRACRQILRFRVPGDPNFATIYYTSRLFPCVPVPQLPPFPWMRNFLERKCKVPFFLFSEPFEKGKRVMPIVSNGNAAGRGSAAGQLPFKSQATTPKPETQALSQK